MSCPVCKGDQIPKDCSAIEKLGKRVIIQGSVYAIIDDEKLARFNKETKSEIFEIGTRFSSTYKPFAEYRTVTLKLYKGKRRYLKFKTQEELDRWPFEEGKNFTVHGCLRLADGKELVFDITQVEPVD